MLELSFLLLSLDLVNDPDNVATILMLQAAGYLGGTLIESGGVATGGNIVIQAGRISDTITAYNIPNGVTVTMQNFTLTDDVTIDITGDSTTSQAILGGTLYPNP